MRGSSGVLVVATLVMMVSLALVLGLVLVLLAELYCSLLLCRRRLQPASSSTIAAAAAAAISPARASESPQLLRPLDQSDPLPLGACSQGALNAPRSFLFPSLPSKDDKAGSNKPQHSQILQILKAQTQEPSTMMPRGTSVVPPFFEPETIPREITLQISNIDCVEDACEGNEDLVYISNPIFDNERSSQEDALFETPVSSPSRLEGSSSDEEDRGDQQSSPTSPSSSLGQPTTPQLTPMKKLPEEACSIPLRDSRSLGSPATDSNSNNGGGSSSTSGTPCTSPSW